jgi:hypothetical protein
MAFQTRYFFVPFHSPAIPTNPAAAKRISRTQLSFSDPWEHPPKLRWTDFSELSKLCFQFAGGKRLAHEVQ